MLTMIVENGLWCTWAACFIRMNNLAERVHQRPLKNQQYCLTKPNKKGHHPSIILIEQNSGFVSLSNIRLMS